MNVTRSYRTPHTASLPFQLTDGKEILVRGTVNHNCDRFSIYLCNGPNSDSDVAFLLNPRFDQNTVVRNHKTGGNWGPEELHGGLPFYRGQKYDVKIVVRQHAYQIFINNNWFCDFNHRMAKEMVGFVYVEGDTLVHAVDFMDSGASSFMNAPVPFTTPIHGGAQPGHALYIDGVPRQGASRFSVNLLCGSNADHDDMALTFDVRFTYGNNNYTVVRNHRSGGNWGSEEIHQNYFPFAYNSRFAIMIMIEHSGIKVSVNNQLFTEFRHRIQPVQRINHLNIQGDVSLTNVRIQ